MLVLENSNFCIWRIDINHDKYSYSKITAKKINITELFCKRKRFDKLEWFMPPDKSFLLNKILFLNEKGLQIHDIDQAKVHKKKLQHMALNTSKNMNTCPCNFINEQN